MMDKIIQTLTLTFTFLYYSIPMLIVGLFISQILIESNIIKKIYFIGKIFTRLANLPEECGIAITTSFIEPRMANIMLVDFYKKGIINKKELYISSLIDAFPAMLRHWDSLLPILLATLGFFGIIYFIILVLIGFIQTLIFMAIGKITLKNREYKEDNTDKKIKLNKDVVYTAFKNTIKYGIPIIRDITIASIITSFLIEFGFFDYITEIIKNKAYYLPLSVEEITVAVTQPINYIGAFVLAGEFLNRGILDEIEVVRALLLGSILSSIPALRFLAPYYIGIYGFKDGFNLMMISTLVRILITALFVIITLIL
ncbi:TPA: hypothetical protein HA335_01205 [Methanocaldococcus jannaschii]|uniref:Uncharacterized protein MJ1556 n=3 Tax=Methanocaldococcus jannaschii TaxID=2190 RepID=Y1556_METJA|nr:RecName: Full=Uncharacterized protein MJ1556 [Methanocaldococcus jannaschii DSM 2661]AAB99576.1 conserved hypothetical protein [Methanocaldococcus jannaschii DSM 2661]HII59191.1 hypothetical protein [Methanocaldococcus jannaschii]